MSTFNGRIAEFPGISIDQFEDINQLSKIFFLSHVHTDHTCGLYDVTFLNNLQKENLTIYSHEVSTTYLRERYQNYAEQFQYLPINIPTPLKSINNFEFTVTLLPAGHCPGSVMFLFESDKHKILYTGDFRLTVSELKKMKGLYTPQNTLKHINKIHLDTTFMYKRYEQFPTREESVEAICDIITQWMDDSKQNILLETSYYYGGEYVITQIYERFNIPVHVSQKSYNEFYRYFPNMDKCITLSNNTQFHMHCGGFKKYCSWGRTITITAMYWNDWNMGDKIVKEENGGYRVCYSTHASLQEIRDILEFLKPEQVEANVEPGDYGDMIELQNLIDDCIQGNSPIKRSPSKILHIGSSNDLKELLPRSNKTEQKSEQNSCKSDEDKNILSDCDDEEYDKLKVVKARKVLKSQGEKRCLDFDLSVFD